MYQIWRYTDDLGGDYDSPRMSRTTDSEREAKDEARKHGGYVIRTSDGAQWSPDQDMFGGGWYHIKGGQMIAAD